MLAFGGYQPTDAEDFDRFTVSMPSQGSELRRVDSESGDFKLAPLSWRRQFHHLTPSKIANTANEGSSRDLLRESKAPRLEKLIWPMNA